MNLHLNHLNEPHHETTTIINVSQYYVTQTNWHLQILVRVLKAWILSYPLCYCGNTDQTLINADAVLDAHTI